MFKSISESILSYFQYQNCLSTVNTEEQIRKKEYVEEYGDFPGSGNPELWQDLPKPFVNPTCLTVPGASCDNDESESTEDWAERMKKLIEELDKDNQEKEDQKNNDNPGDSCGIGDKDKHFDPQAISESQNNDDGQPEGSSENTGNPWDDVSDSDFDEFLNTKPNYEPSPTARDIAEHGWNRPDQQLFRERGINSQEELAERVENTINSPQEVLSRTRDGAIGYYDEKSGIAIIDNTEGNKNKKPEAQIDSTTFVTTDQSTGLPIKPRDYLINDGFIPQ